uniref:Uncharacterized protein n=1 Tax=Oryza punctata TaxID=4537 RepID=A0A0E0KNG9_ORYPU
MFEFLADILLGDMPLAPTDKLLKSPSRHILECRGIARDVLMNIDKTEVHLDFHIFNAKPHLKHNPTEKVMFVSPFALSNPVLFEGQKFSAHKEDDLGNENERSSSPLIKFKLLRSCPQYGVLSDSRESTMIFRDKSLGKENFWAMEELEEPTLDSDRKDHLDEHGSFFLEHQVPCSLKSTTFCVTSTYNHLKILAGKIFRSYNFDDELTIGGEVGDYNVNGDCNVNIPHGRAFDHKQSTAWR